MLFESRKVAFKYFRTSVSKSPWNFLRASRLPIARCIYLRDSFSRGPYIRDEVHPLKPASSPAIFKTGRSEQIAPFLSSISFAMSTSLITINDCPAASAYTMLPGMSLSWPH